MHKAKDREDIRKRRRGIQKNPAAFLKKTAGFSTQHLYA